MGSEENSLTAGRSGDRRQTDRRKGDRRSPPPIWRRPIAYVSYGLFASLLLVLAMRSLGSDESGSTAQAAFSAPEPTVAAATTEPPGAAGPAREVLTVADYESLVAEGEAAVGQLIRAELYCGTIYAVSVRVGTGTDPVLSEMTGTDGRVAGAECRWSDEGRAAEFLLIIPPELAQEFAEAPQVELNFVTRRRVDAYVQWLGRSDALALRNAGILRRIGS